jgi:hypothetical protein
MAYNLYNCYFSIIRGEKTSEVSSGCLEIEARSETSEVFPIFLEDMNS